MVLARRWSCGFFGSSGAAWSARQHVRREPPLHERLFHGELRVGRRQGGHRQIEGVIMEGTLNYAHRQIERPAGTRTSRRWSCASTAPAAASPPATTCTAGSPSCATAAHARTSTPRSRWSCRWAAMAASGGYYVAMPGKPHLRRADHHHRLHRRLRLVPQRRRSWPTSTASRWRLIKRGDVKDSGSLFQEMTAAGAASLAGHGRSRLRAVPGRGRGGPAEAEGQARGGGHRKSNRGH